MLRLRFSVDSVHNAMVEMRWAWARRQCPLLYNLDGDWWAEAMLDQMDGRESPWRAVSGSAAATRQSTL